MTQGLLDGAEGDHTGVDIAVPTDSYIRAAGGGTVVDLKLIDGTAVASMGYDGVQTIRVDDE